MTHTGPYSLNSPVRLHVPRVALTGGTGFIGTAVLASLLTQGFPTAVLARDPAAIQPSGMWLGDAPWPRTRSLRVVAGHLADSDALETLCAEARILIHAASYVGPDADLQRNINVDGTRALMNAARRRGVQRIVYVSTAGVYGGKLGPGYSESEATASPRSSLSRSRLDAEHIVLSSGGIVIRPHLVHGTGDRWFLTPLLAATLRLQAWIGGPDVALSTIGRTRLGGLIVSAGLHASTGIYHAAERSPARVRDLVEPVLRRLGTSLPERVLSPTAAAAKLRPFGITQEQIDLIGRDSWFQTERLWSVRDRARFPTSMSGLRVPEGVDWYARAARGGTTDGV